METRVYGRGESQGVGKRSIIKVSVGLAIVGIYYLSLRAAQSHWDSLSGELHRLVGTMKFFFFTFCGRLYAS